MTPAEVLIPAILKPKLSVAVPTAMKTRSAVPSSSANSALGFIRRPPVHDCRAYAKGSSICTDHPMNAMQMRFRSSYFDLKKA
jgi:hypothetical protein